MDWESTWKRIDNLPPEKKTTLICMLWGAYEGANQDAERTGKRMLELLTKAEKESEWERSR